MIMLCQSSVVYMKTLILLVTKHGSRALSSASCLAYQTALIIFTFFCSFPQRTQVYSSMMLNQMFVCNQAVGISLQSEKNSTTRTFNRILSFKQQSLRFFLFQLNVVRKFLKATLINDNAIEISNILLNEKIELIDKSNSALIQDKPDRRSVTIQSLLGKDTWSFSCLGPIEDQVVARLSGDILQLAAENEEAFTSCKLFLNSLGRNANQSTLLNQLKKYCGAIINRQATFRDIRLNLLDQV
jgi:hypothetical protein